jgi:hypothetical protein
LRTGTNIEKPSQKLGDCIMARGIERLSERRITSLTKVGVHADGGGLYLKIGPTGGKSWVFRYTITGRARVMGLGPVHTVSLAAARTKARALRAQKLDGTDPLTARRTERAARMVVAVTFAGCADG